MTNNRPKTIICDIDGTLIKHTGDITNLFNNKPEILPNVIDCIKDWDRKGYNIILITGRKESVRKHTEEQLAKVGIIYDQLIMGVGGGTRVLINDLEPNSHEKTAIAINLERNKGFDGVDI